MRLQKRDILIKRPKILRDSESCHTEGRPKLILKNQHCLKNVVMHNISKEECQESWHSPQVLKSKQIYSSRPFNKTLPQSNSFLGRSDLALDKIFHATYVSRVTSFFELLIWLTHWLKFSLLGALVPYFELLVSTMTFIGNDVRSINPVGNHDL